MSKASLLPEREYIAILQLVVPMVEAKQSRALTPGDFDGKAYAIELIEAFAAQRKEDEPVAEPEVPPVVEPEEEPEPKPDSPPPEDETE